MAIATGTAIALSAGIGAGASLGGAALGSRAAGKAAKQQADATQAALEQQRAMYEQTRGDLGPYRETGGQGLTSLAGLLGVGAGPGGGAIGAGLESSPGYQFRLNEGLKALQRSAAARGTLLTGGTLKGLERYAQDYASGEYANRVNQLAGLAGMGANAAAGQAGANAGFGSAAGDLLTQRGNAAAAGTIGGANAWQQAIGSAGNLAQMYYLSRLFQPAGTGAAPTPPPAWFGGGSYT